MRNRIRLKIVLPVIFTLIFTSIFSTSVVFAEKNDQKESIDLAGTDYIDGRIIVCMDGNASGISRQRSAYQIDPIITLNAETDQKTFSVQSEATSEHENQERTIAVVTGGSTEKLLAEFEDRPEVLYAEPDYSIHAASFGETEPYYAEQWMLQNQGQYDWMAENDCHIPEAWKLGYTGEKGTVVAVVDSGVDYTSPELSAQMWTAGEQYESLTALGGGKYGICVNEGRADGSAYNSKDPMDDAGHGTHCAGIIGAAWNGTGIAGINPHARIMAVKFLNNQGSGSYSGALRAYAYLNAAVDAGVPLSVVNNSWMFGRFTYALRDMVDELGEKGVLSVFASGNDGLNVDQSETKVGSSPYMLNVAAVAPDGKRAAFSNYGEKQVQVAAPGQGVLSILPQKEENCTLAEQPFLPQLDPEAVLGRQDFEEENALDKIKITKKVNCDLLDSSKLQDDWYGKSPVYSFKIQPERGFYIATWEITLDDSFDTEKAKELYLDVRSKGADVLWYVKGISDTGAYEIGLQGSVNHYWSPLTFHIPEELQGKQIKKLEIEASWENSDPEVSLAFDNLTFGMRKQPYIYMKGTSMAAPVVTGCASLLAAEGMKLSEVKARIVGGVTRTENLKNVSLSGGMLNMEKAVQNPEPAVDHLTLEDGELVLHGYFFGNEPGTVMVQEQNSQVIQWSDREIRVSIPKESQGNMKVSVTTSDGRTGKNYLNVYQKESGWQNLSTENFPYNTVYMRSAFCSWGKDLYGAFIKESDNGSPLVFMRYRTETGKWEQLPSPQTRAYTDSAVSMIAKNGMIYCWYQMPLQGEVLAKYDVQKNSWTERSLFLIDSGLEACNDRGLTLVEYQDQVLTIGGLEKATMGYEKPYVSPLVYELDLETLNLKKWHSELPHSRYASRNATYQDRLVIYGSKYDKTVTSIVDMYDGKEWKSYPEIPNVDQSVLGQGAIAAVEDGILFAANTHSNPSAGGDTWFVPYDGKTWQCTGDTFYPDKYVMLGGIGWNDKFYAIGQTEDPDQPMVFKCMDAKTEPVPMVPDGWHQNEDGSWSYGKDGANVYNSWIKEGNSWCYLDENGKRKEGWFQDQGVWYYLNPDDGKAAIGWKKINHAWYYFDRWGGMYENRWLKDKNIWYHFDQWGAMRANRWYKENNVWYHFNQWGAMQTDSWYKEKNIWYYLNQWGVMQTNSWKKIKGQWYYFDKNGIMAADTWVGSYHVNKYGVWDKTR